MAELNYDEVTHAVYPSEYSDELCRFETRFPERLSRLSVGDVDFFNFSRHSDKGRRNKNSARYRTQPITFDEIAEVDEEHVPSSQQAKVGRLFQKSLDKHDKEDEGHERTSEAQVHPSSDKENNPCTPSELPSPPPSFYISRQRRRRLSFRKLRNRHSVAEEISERSEDTECATDV